ncbi:hypothetical protein HYALB_00005936 [Hymenoscyphus albidus]|uniref:Uncharacterized protein n=1 Tax=Hymenoscyphus albidus TaxID=595503 RepID=A0A9N9LBX7_9HELO|nr:hypothetical protein HYALB_00005936 [Hymenoscyphus albidus]
MPSFINNIVTFALASLVLVSNVAGDKLIFRNRSDQVCWIDFTPNTDGTKGIGDIRVDPKQDVEFSMDGYGPEWDRGRGWRGNFRAHRDGAPRDYDHIASIATLNILSSTPLMSQLFVTRTPGRESTGCTHEVTQEPASQAVTTSLAVHATSTPGTTGKPRPPPPTTSTSRSATAKRPFASPESRLEPILLK